MSNNETCVPAKAVQIDGTAPEQGDEIEVKLKGKVTRVDGENIYFQPTEANGEPMAAADDAEGGDDEQAEGDPTEAGLRAQAAKADEMA